MQTSNEEEKCPQTLGPLRRPGAEGGAVRTNTTTGFTYARLAFSTAAKRTAPLANAESADTATAVLAARSLWPTSRTVLADLGEFGVSAINEAIFDVTVLHVPFRHGCRGGCAADGSAFATATYWAAASRRCAWLARRSKYAQGNFLLTFAFAHDSALHADNLGIRADLEGLVLAADNLLPRAADTISLACLAGLARSRSWEILVVDAPAACECRGLLLIRVGDFAESGALATATIGWCEGLTVACKSSCGGLGWC